MTIYSKAIKALKKQGWNKGEYIDPNTGCVCAYGALALGSGKATVENVGPEDEPYYHIAPTEGDLARLYQSFQYHELDTSSILQVLRELPPEKGGQTQHVAIALWNDDYAENVDEVIALFQRAHEIEKAKK